MHPQSFTNNNNNNIKIYDGEENNASVGVIHA
jgi:hypothetical protein